MKIIVYLCIGIFIFISWLHYRKHERLLKKFYVAKIKNGIYPSRKKIIIIHRILYFCTVVTVICAILIITVYPFFNPAKIFSLADNPEMIKKLMPIWVFTLSFFIQIVLAILRIMISLSYDAPKINKKSWIKQMLLLEVINIVVNNLVTIFSFYLK